MQEKQKNQRGDLMALWIGITFSAVFTGMIWLTGRFLDTSNFLPDYGASWYFWRLPNPTFWTRATAWGGYLAHQFTIWAIIYYGQKNLKKYSTSLRKANWLMLGANALFIILHLVQTQIWYDGLAQDVSIWSSQISVIILLVWTLLMENQRRGMFAGKKLPISKQIIQFARKYHGYYFAWATIYTFWYHPMEATSGHLIGFFYMFLLLLQGSLFFTKIHVNRWWGLVNEATVVIHGTLVAVMQGNNLWPMFFFGFAGVFVITQMHGLKLPNWSKWTIFAAYIMGAIWIYSGRGYGKLYELVSIPLIEYLSVFVLALLFGLGLRVFKKEPVPIFARSDRHKNNQ
jgi:hypothetical protein